MKHTAKPGIYGSLLEHRPRGVTQPLATYAWNGPRATRWWMSWSAGRGVVACRGKSLAAVDVLSRPGACRSPGLAGTRGASRQVSCRALVGLPGMLLLPGSCASSGLPGKLLLPGPCFLRVAFPASSSCWGLVSWLKYFVLEW